MTRSMTAFARVQTECDGMSLCWEVRAVNHRYMDVFFRLPEAWRFLDAELRTRCRNIIHRGKIECQLKTSDVFQINPRIVINYPLVDSLLLATETLAESKSLQDDMTLSTLLKWPGVVEISSPNIEQYNEIVLNLFDKALNQLQEARDSEGATLRHYIQQRLTQLQESIQKACELTESALTQTREKLLSKLRSLYIEVDTARIEQEIAIMLTRLDVSEELDRLMAHTDEVLKSLHQKEPVGRRLDFLMQELNREANTLSSKSDSVFLTQCAVEMKVLIEQMREQIQNIE
jgi:uncharacterized protein (TIGR00255 family)